MSLIVKNTGLKECAKQVDESTTEKTCLDCKSHFFSDCYLECRKKSRINNPAICSEFEAEAK